MNCRTFSQNLLTREKSHHHTTTPSCAIACICICAHLKDPVVHVRVRSITETLKKKQHAPQVGLCDSVAAGFPRGRQPEFPIGDIPLGQCSCKKVFFFFSYKKNKNKTIDACTSGIITDKANEQLKSAMCLKPSLTLTFILNANSRMRNARRRNCFLTLYKLR